MSHARIIIVCRFRIQNEYADMEYGVVERLNGQLYLLERSGKGSKSQRVTHAAGLVRIDNRIDNNVEESERVEELVRIPNIRSGIVENEVPVESTFRRSTRVTACTHSNPFNEPMSAVQI